VKSTMVLMLVLTGWGASAQDQPTQTDASQSSAQKKLAPQPKPSSARSQDPSNYIEVIEEVGNKRILHYYPGAAHDYLRSHEFKVDLGSILLIRVVPERLSAKAAISNLLITAQLKHGSTTTNVEVKGYSVVGQSQTLGQSQTAVNSNSITNVAAQMENLFYVAQLILQQTMPGCLTRVRGSTAPLFDPAVLKECNQWTPAQAAPAGANPQAGGAAATADAAVTAVFQKYQPEITAFVTFFTDPQNAFLQTYFANKFFGMDLASVQSVAKQFQTALAAAQTASAPDAQTAAKPNYAALLQRTVLAYEDIWTEITNPKPTEKTEAKATDEYETTREADIANWKEAKTDPDKTQTMVENYFNGLPKQLFKELQAYLVVGQIILPDYKGQPGDVLTVVVEAKPAATPNNNNPTGAVLQFQIVLDGFGMSVGPSSSLFFLKRIGVPIPATSATPPTGPQPVNFAPSPGASFGFTFRYRNYGKCDEPAHRPDSQAPAEEVCQNNRRLGLSEPDKFPDLHPNYMRKENSGFGQLMRALAPGLSMNVSFMNWNSPTDFDTTTGKFSSSSAASIQVGAGFVASLFDNQIQFTYGWNLQVPQNRQYWGVGFGFVEIGKTLAGYAKAKASSSGQ
jgi:hypothetical protein